MKRIILILMIAALCVSTVTAYSFSSSSPLVAQNGDRRGFDNDGDGRRETVFVNGYTRSDGTYVRSHYRAAPSTSSFSF